MVMKILPPLRQLEFKPNGDRTQFQLILRFRASEEPAEMSLSLSTPDLLAVLTALQAIQQQLNTPIPPSHPPSGKPTLALVWDADNPS